MTNQPFFSRDRDTYTPNPIASGPWDPNSLHGRVVIGLLAFAIEQRHGAEEFVPARLTVDMFRLPNLSPVEITTRVVRDGLRIKVIEADFVSGGVSMARASCQLLRKTEKPPGEVWSPPSKAEKRHYPAYRRVFASANPVNQDCQAEVGTLVSDTARGRKRGIAI